MQIQYCFNNVNKDYLISNSSDDGVNGNEMLPI